MALLTRLRRDFIPPKTKNRFATSELLRAARFLLFLKGARTRSFVLVERKPFRLPQSVVAGMTTVFVALTIITFPTYPAIVTDALCEKAVLIHAHEHHWQFGTDIVFTYGPLGFLTSRNFFAAAAGLRLAADILFALIVCAGVVMLAWRLPQVWRWSLVATFCFLNANIDPHYDLLLYSGTLAWSILCLVEDNRRLGAAIVCLSLLTAFGVLVKANFLFAAALTLPAVAIDLCLRRRPRAAAGLLVTTAVLFLAGWFAAGQGWSNLPAFFAHVPIIAAGYNAAVALDGLQILRSRGFLAAILLIICALFRAWSTYAKHPEDSPGARTSPLRPLILALWLGGLVSLVWKHGFVRGDWFHMGFFFGFAPLCALALEALPTTKPWADRVFRILAIICAFVVLFTVQRWCFAPLPGSLIRPFRAAFRNASILVHQQNFRADALQQQNAALSSLDLPTIRQIPGTATVDVFGQGQLYALQNHLNYHPRPVFQSYMGFNAGLNTLNENFYLSTNAPEYVIFELIPIDHKFPPLEDSFVFRDLLLNYSLAAEEASCLLLKRETIAPPRLTLLKTGNATLGKRIDLAPFAETNIWIQIIAQPTFTGRIRTLLNKPAVLRLNAWTQNKKFSGKAPAPMLASGFVASPLLIDTDDVRDFFKNENQKRPDSYSITTDPGNESYWQPHLEYRIYALERKGD
jgi:hypothetical protein